MISDSGADAIAPNQPADMVRPQGTKASPSQSSVWESVSPTLICSS
jgi:hypothetical protein